MEKRLIYITEFDFQRLQTLIRSAGPDSRNKRHLKELQEELEQGEIVLPSEIPADVVTMNSRVRLRDIDSGEVVIYTLVFPYEADIQQNKISILAPIGVALIGYHTGEIVTWHIPSGERRFEIEAVLYQPEASGDYHL